MNPPSPPPAQKPSVAWNPALLWVSGGALVLFIIGAFVLFLLMTRTEPLAQRLVREARSFHGDDWPRPSHHEPAVPGRFAEALTPLLPELELMPELAPNELTCPRGEDALHEDERYDVDAELFAHEQARVELEEQCLLVSRGEAPLDTAPWECLEQLRTHRELLHRVLATTRAELGGLPEQLGSLARPAAEEPVGLALLERVVRLAALETQVLRAEGRPEEAVDTCLDGLALSREMSLGAGMYGLSMSARCHDVLFLPCAAALEAAPLERQREALEQLARLRQGYPPLSVVLREESVYQQLFNYGELLSPPALDALPEQAQELVSHLDSYDYYRPPGTYPRLRPYVWRRNAAMFDELVAAADLPAEQRGRAFASIDVAQSLLLQEQAWRAQDYSQQAQPREDQHHQALALAAIVEAHLARAEQGTWPEQLSPLVAGTLFLEADNSLEAWLVPGDTVRGVPELRLTAQQPPPPRPRYAGGGGLR
jgi:hypothetical protein